MAPGEKREDSNILGVNFNVLINVSMQRGDDAVAAGEDRRPDDNVETFRRRFTTYVDRGKCERRDIERHTVRHAVRPKRLRERERER